MYFIFFFFFFWKIKALNIYGTWWISLVLRFFNQSTLELYSPNKIQLEIQLVSIHFSAREFFQIYPGEMKSKLDTSHLSHKLRYLTIFFKMSQELFLQSNHGKRILIQLLIISYRIFVPSSQFLDRLAPSIFNRKLGLFDSRLLERRRRKMNFEERCSMEKIVFFFSIYILYTLVCRVNLAGEDWQTNTGGTGGGGRRRKRQGASVSLRRSRGAPQASIPKAAVSKQVASNMAPLFHARMPFFAFLLSPSLHPPPVPSNESSLAKVTPRTSLEKIKSRTRKQIIFSEDNSF